MDIQDEQDIILCILYIHVIFFILESSDFMWCRYRKTRMDIGATVEAVMLMIF